MDGMQFFEDLEQEQVRGLIRRTLRLEWLRGVCVALAMPALTVGAAFAQSTPTTTTLTAGSLSGCVQRLTVAVVAAGQPAAGTVSIIDEFNGKDVQLASVALDSTGSASPSVSLEAGSHSLKAEYAGNTTNESSISPAVTESTTTQCEFTVSASSLSPSSTLVPGHSATSTISITPSIEYTSTLTAPMSVTLSCSGLPDQAACVFTPETIEILPSTIAAVTSSMLIETQAASTASLMLAARPITWALLLPGGLGLLGLAWGSRRRRWLYRLSLLALVGLVTMLGTTACSPRYSYYHHGPTPNPATPAGTYTIQVTAQSSNSVTAITHSTSMVVTVQ